MQIYVTKPGDTLTSIARKFNVDLDELIEINDIKNVNSLVVGQALIIETDFNSVYIVKPGDTIFMGNNEWWLKGCKIICFVNSFDYKINDIYDILIVNEVISVRKLFILRGAMASGKSTFIKNNDLEDFTLSADRIRLMYNSPEMTVNYNEMIPQYNNTKVWNLLFQILEDRMRKGELTEYSNAWEP